MELSVTLGGKSGDDFRGFRDRHKEGLNIQSQFAVNTAIKNLKAREPEETLRTLGT
jgi:hypothetical protein